MIQQVLEEALELGRANLSQGKVATFIPELGRANPQWLGACVKTVAGETFHCGDWQRKFTIQSIAKTVSLIFALRREGAESLFRRVGMEPSCDAFNSLSHLEETSAIPLNPMMNAGALVTASSCAADRDADAAFADFLDYLRLLCGRDDIRMDEAAYRSESEHGGRNRSIAYLLHDRGGLSCSPETTADFYFRICSIAVTIEDLAHYARILANRGADPVTGEQKIDPWIVPIVKTIMFTCGLYDWSGEFAVRVGLPAKSGVGGGILAVAENEMGIAVFGPALDGRGNSVGGVRMMEHLSRRLGLHCFSGRMRYSSPS